MSTNISRTQSKSPPVPRPSLLPSALPREASPHDLQSRAGEHPQLVQEASAESGQPEFNALEPFFVHVEDVHSASTHHPAVHYIFSDDDGGVLTDKLLRIEAGGAASKRGGGAPAAERVVVLSVGADGRSVQEFASMSAEWQVLAAEVSSAPTLEGEGEDGGLMLRIRGTGGVREGSGDGSRDATTPETSLEAVVANYRERMDELKKILESGAR